MKALIFLLAFAPSASSILPPCIHGYLQREYVFARGQVKVTRFDLPDIVKGLRVNLVYYGGESDGPTETVVLGTARTDDYGFYAVAGFAQQECYGGPQLYLELYNDKLARYPLSKVEVPDEYAHFDYQPVKIFEKNITAQYRPPPS